MHASRLFSAALTTVLAAALAVQSKANVFDVDGVPLSRRADNVRLSLSLTALYSVIGNQYISGWALPIDIMSDDQLKTGFRMTFDSGSHKMCVLPLWSAGRNAACV